jgi:hypothetical protein
MPSSDASTVDLVTAISSAVAAMAGLAAAVAGAIAAKASRDSAKSSLAVSKDAAVALSLATQPKLEVRPGGSAFEENFMRVSFRLRNVGIDPAVDVEIELRQADGTLLGRDEVELLESYPGTGPFQMSEGPFWVSREVEVPRGADALPWTVTVRFSAANRAARWETSGVFPAGGTAQPDWWEVRRIS